MPEQNNITPLLTPMQSAAVDYIRQGYAVIPSFSYKMLIADEKLKRLQDSRFPVDWFFYWLAQKLCKAPLRILPYLRPITSEAKALQWFGRYRDANIVLAAGKAANIVVLDVDFHRKAHKRIAELNLPETRRVATGRGEHYYFRYPPDISITRRHIHKNYLLGDACNATVPPSMHIVGKEYAWLDPSAEIAPLPVCLYHANRTFISHPFLIQTYRTIKNSCFIYLLYPITCFYFQLRFRSAGSQRSNDALSCSAEIYSKRFFQ